MTTTHSGTAALMLDATHDPGLRSWVDSANTAGDFPIQNLPYGRFRRVNETSESWRLGVAIGDWVLDLRALHASGLPLPSELAESTLNAFMALDSSIHQRVRTDLSGWLRQGSEQREVLQACLIARADVVLGVPCTIGDYTDFYAGIHHATAVGKIFRPDQPLMPNYKWVPIGYHGRSSSIRASPDDVTRPHGQTKAADAAAPTYGPSRRLDFELELGILVGRGNALGQRVTIDDADERWFGMVALNDWSARDIQAWEYQPLGPFLAKSFATTISPWVVTAQALAPFRRPFSRAFGDPEPLAHLDSAQVRSHGHVEIRLQVLLRTARMRSEGLAASPISESSFLHSYWTTAQLLAHHASNGCNLQSGDLLGTGTLSGPSIEQSGSLLELSRAGAKPLTLPNGERRTFLEDGDEVTIRAWCERDGLKIGFGDCVGTIMPAAPQ